ncbi:MAG TPA: hypothetical protein LFW11_04700 [Rickettsia endosymbiont of Proechinophthirus fluctus]|nr:hypothetical protein [Rickettsia endosymbiont of Proechinophthirus fluctus]
MDTVVKPRYDTARIS